jgi:hypothetical protein
MVSLAKKGARAPVLIFPAVAAAGAEAVEVGPVVARRLVEDDLETGQ